MHLLAASALYGHVPSVSAMRFASIHPPQMAAALRFGRSPRRSSAAVRARGLAIADRTGFADLTAGGDWPRPASFWRTISRMAGVQDPWLPTTLEFAPLAVWLPIAPPRAPGTANGPGAEPPATVTFVPPSLACWWLY